MKIKVVTQIIFALLIAALMSGCSQNSKTIQLTEQDSSSEVTLHEGDLIHVSLAANPSTGYTWEWIDDGSGILSQDGEPTYKSESDLVGSGGTSTYSFKIVKTGQATLQLIYHRTFEPDVAPLREFSVSVTVE